MNSRDATCMPADSESEFDPRGNRLGLIRGRSEHRRVVDVLRHRAVHDAGIDLRRGGIAELDVFRVAGQRLEVEHVAEATRRLLAVDELAVLMAAGAMSLEDLHHHRGWIAVRRCGGGFSPGGRFRRCGRLFLVSRFRRGSLFGRVVVGWILGRGVVLRLVGVIVFRRRGIVFQFDVAAQPLEDCVKVLLNGGRIGLRQKDGIFVLRQGDGAKQAKGRDKSRENAAPHESLR